MSNRQAGFTIIELVMVIVILGILAVVALPRLNTSDYRATQFHDQTVAALRYAQKAATSHRRLVCVTFTSSSVTLTMALTTPAANCSGSTSPLLMPGTNSNVVQSTDTTIAVFSPVPSALNFQPDGTATDATLSISGQSAITVVGASGYVL